MEIGGQSTYLDSAKGALGQGSNLDDSQLDSGAEISRSTLKHTLE